MPKNEEFSRSVENAEIELDKNSNEIETVIGNQRALTEVGYFIE